MSEFRTPTGPPPTQFLQALQSITTAINGQTVALNAVAGSGTVPASMITLSEIATPATPTSGFVLYVDVADHRLKARGSAGTITTLANP